MLKKVEAIVRKGALKKILANLSEINYPGVTITEAEGHGKQRGVKEHYRNQTGRSLLSKIKVEVIVDADAAKEVCEAIIKATRTGENGDGKIFVTTVDEAIRIRTGEKGKKAID